MPSNLRLAGGAVLLSIGACDARRPSVAAEPSASVVSNAPAATLSASSAAATLSASSAASPPPVPAARVLDCGTTFGCTIVGEGKVACWGRNTLGQLGGKTASPAFVKVPPARVIAVGYAHACALTTDGDVYCWGSESSGAIGDGVASAPEAPSRVVRPIRVAGLTTKAIDLDVGLAHSCAVLEDGTAACWGGNFAGALGAFGGESSPSPQPIAGVKDAVAVAAGDELTCVRASHGAVSCWGRDRPPPGALAGVCARQVAVAGLDVCVIDCGGALRCGQIGGVSPSAFAPKQGLASAAEVRGGLGHFVARDGAGHVFAWGGNDSGQLGNGKPASWMDASSDAPVAVQGSFVADAVCAGGITARPGDRPYLRPSTFVDTGTSCARTPGQEVFCWGEPNLDYVPVPVTLPR